MAVLSEKSIRIKLESILDPILQIPLSTAGWLQSLEVDNDKVKVVLQLGYFSNNYQAKWQEMVDQAISCPVELTCQVNIQSMAVQKNTKPKVGVKNVIAVASGKGGVGKSSIAVNMALALQRLGARVGLLDADIYGPSGPLMLGINQKPDVVDNCFVPIERYGLSLMSMGFLVDQDTPAIWRGPMASKALQQMFNETKWNNLDYLIVDLPPGTGDIQLTLAQKIPISGAVIVTTPQAVALGDAKKALAMFKKLDIKVLGIVENMSSHICPQCSFEVALFGQGGGQSMADNYQVPLLGKMPLDASICDLLDKGIPPVWSEPDSTISQGFIAMATNTAAYLSQGKRDLNIPLSNIVIEDA